MGAISFVIKIVLKIINSLLLTIGMVFVVLGIVMAAGGEVLTYLTDKFKDELQAAYTATGTSVDSSQMSLVDLLFPVGVAFIAIGALIMAVAIIGLIALFCSFKILLTVYVCVLAGIFLPQFIIVLIIYIDDSVFEDAVKPYLKDTLHDFTGLDGTDTTTVMWNGIMAYEGCCGVDNHTDFQDSEVTNWPPSTVNSQSVNLETPVMCCRTKSTDYTCAEVGTATTANNYMDEGCYKEIYKRMTENAMVITVIVFCLLIQLACIVLVIWVLCHNDNTIGIL